MERETILIQEWGKDLKNGGFLTKFLEKISGNYDFFKSHSPFVYEEESSETFKTFIRWYRTKEECTLDEAITSFSRKLFGDIEYTGQEYGYSEYTIEGFSVDNAVMGGHDFNKIFNNESDNSFITILIDIVE